MTYDKSGLFIDTEKLAVYAENHARSIKIDSRARGGDIAARLRSALSAIADAHDALALRSHSAVSGAAGWLLDNHYLARREGLAAAADFARVAKLRASGGEAVIMSLCSALVRSGFCAVDEERCAEFLSGFQRKIVLSRSELSLFIPGLKASLVLVLSERCSEPESEADEERFKNIFTSLRYLATADLSTLLQNADFTEQLLRRDPAGVYPAMDEASRASYRDAVARIARQNGAAEHRIAERALSLAADGAGMRRHVGYWLITAPMGTEKKRRSGRGYICTIVLASIAIALFLGFLAKSVLAALLLVIPASELIKNIADFALMRLSTPTVLPRLALDGGVPDSGKSLCVVSSLITGCDSGKALAKKLEHHRLLSRSAGKNLRFAILADLPDTKSADIPGSSEWTASAAKEIERLNERYGGGFYLFCRERTERDGRWMGHERKRGALCELMQLLRGGEGSLRCLAGDMSALEGTAFLITLDSDTVLAPGAAAEMIGAMLHPLNRPVIDPEKGIVRSGHGIISPRIGTDLPSATASDFSRVMCSPGGSEVYGGSCGELYMDNWQSGGFAGKGIIDIDTYLACMSDRIPDNSVLSHDALEGAFLRAGFMGSCEVLDSHPAGVLPYFRRMERWVRGDWQNSPWVFRRGKALPEIERFRLFDSLRRSLVPVTVFSAIALGLFFPRHGFPLAAAAALAACFSQLVITLTQVLFRNEDYAPPKMHSLVYHGLGGALVRSFLRLVLLPAEAYYCACAIARALWRMLVSHRKMLQWQTSLQSEGVKSGLAGHMLALWPPVVFSLALIFLSPTVIGRAAGVIWLLLPLFALLLSLPSKPNKSLSEEDRLYLLDCAGDIWRYFDRFLAPEDNFLPPDNHQLRPPVGTAHRTSPTNIGLAMLSVIAALDLGLCGAEKAAEKLSCCLDTVEKLDKWHGHLYNWYDTRTLAPLSPRYVSTVDSGNLCACLISAAQALEELSMPQLAEKCRVLAENMRFSPLFDSERKLFHIGINTETGRADDSWYDLFASEARLTSYLAVARGEVPRTHWRRLSRAMLQQRGYRGLASWTGTMFEYLMPELLLQPQPDSLFHESARFCLGVQRSRTREAGLPWGISESAYYSLDPGMNYRYKAHGCAGLALKKGMDSETVISPYSSFLALYLAPRAVIKNLRQLEKMGMRGEFGFFEALDATPARCGAGEAKVYSHMSHHLGMSMVAIQNCLLDGIARRRFMAEPAMGAHVGLLQEKLPLGGLVIRRGTSEPPTKPAKPPLESPRLEGEGVNSATPHCRLMANRVCSLLVTDGGFAESRWGVLSPYLSPSAPLEGGHGLDFYLHFEGRRLPLLPSPAEGEHFRWSLSSSLCSTEGFCAGIQSRVETMLPSDLPGEKRRVTLRAENAQSAVLELSFQALLARRIDYVNHPAFFRLGLSVWAEGGCLIIRRRRRGEVPECFMALACSRPCAFFAGTESVSSRPGKALEIGEAEYAMSEPNISCRVELSLGANVDAETVFTLSYAKDPRSAAESARSILSSQDEHNADLPRTAAMLLGMDAQDLEHAFELLSHLAFPAPVQSRENLQRKGLWQNGISGDEPIVCAEFSSSAQLETARKLMDLHLFLCGCGMDFDLVFISRDGGSYRRPLNTALTEALWRSGGEVLMDSRGGVHIVDEGDGADAVRSCAALHLELEDGIVLPKRKEPSRPHPQFYEPVRRGLALPKYQWSSSGDFEFYVNRSLPPRAWANMLTNGRIGFLASDCGTGNLWYLNSRENPITPWLCELRSTAGPERLFVECQGNFSSLFASPDDGNCRVSFGFGYARWKKRIGDIKLSTTAFIPPDTDARVFIVRAEGYTDDAALHWHLPLALSSNAADARCCLLSFDSGFIKAENPRAMAHARPLFVGADRSFAFTGRGESALALSYDGCLELSASPTAALKMPLDNQCVLVCGCCEKEALRALCSTCDAEKALQSTLEHWRGITQRFLLRCAAPALEKLANGWLVYQSLACRIMGRCGMYQSGGAFGFRDQLQDAVNLIPIDPAIARSQILRSCARQYTEGDVQHWWHEGGAEIRGVRTHCSDDLLWLPWALCEYVEQSGDRSLCSENVAYISSPELGEGERDRYEAARPCPLSESVLMHCLRAMECVLRRGTGSHGLLKIGSGDWNDGFDAVRGESQWLTWFFIMVAGRFIPLAHSFGLKISSRLLEAPEKLLKSAEGAWDGKWYRRGYYADGSPLGSAESAEGSIDSIAQSFAAMCPGADRERALTALDSAYKMLYERKSGLVKLFTPPFAEAEDPGYIRSYGPGFRENGGQYTHAAIWLSMAFFRTGQPDRGFELLSALLPADKPVSRYMAEPFVIAADVYSAPGHEGEGGWSWYTGSAGWLLTLIRRELLGLQLEGGRLYIRPNLPAALPSFEAEFRGKRIKVDGSGVSVDGKPYTGEGIDIFPPKRSQ